jgi:hypothetical protein
VRATLLAQRVVYGRDDLYTKEGKKEGQQHPPEFVDGPATFAEETVEG